jgi:hypothetical protein
MAFAGFKKPKDRADVIAYLKVILINVAYDQITFYSPLYYYFL